jgi:hypothetical protein
VFGRAGVFTVRASVADAVGNTATAARGVAIDAITHTPPDTGRRSSHGWACPRPTRAAGTG